MVYNQFLDHMKMFDMLQAEEFTEADGEMGPEEIEEKMTKKREFNNCPEGYPKSNHEASFHFPPAISPPYEYPPSNPLFPP
jgi:hypothetical protein